MAEITSVENPVKQRSVGINTILFIIGKVSVLDRSWLEQIDHQKLELSACCLIMYIDYSGQM